MASSPPADRDHHQSLKLLSPTVQRFSFQLRARPTRQGVITAQIKALKSSLEDLACLILLLSNP